MVPCSVFKHFKGLKVPCSSLRCLVGPLTIIEKPVKINFPGKSWKTCKKLKVMEKKLKAVKKFCEGLFENNSLF